MIDDDECALWRQAVAAPPVAGALEVYCDLLETRDPARARFLRKRMRGKAKYTAKEEKVWIEALGLERCESIDFDPLPTRVCIDATRIDCLDAVLAQLPFLLVHLSFDNTGAFTSIFHVRRRQAAGVVVSRTARSDRSRGDWRRTEA